MATNRLGDHGLIRLIGRGSYGEVWLAQNVTGALRAVKVVWRAKFQDERPYEREFEGIKRYEPISRKHDGLVEVLHVGRDPEGRCFFYVMELADDATSNAPLRPENLDAQGGQYRPKTLRDVLRQRGRLPIVECLDIAERLASGLARLHEHGLVHRDIKPSNVIFVGGHPKLADIGLVAGMDETQSFVGTEGFVPPEGPGKAQADIYSLGKVLYEMATGMDRNEFPRLPATSDSSTSSLEDFAEFNEILIRACDPEPSRRYASAEELRRELLFLQGGKSVRELRGLERRAAVARKISITAAVVALVAGFAYFGSIKQIQRAREAETAAVATVQMLRLQKAEDMFRLDEPGMALALLAHVVRENPSHPVAVRRLMSVLTWGDFLLPRFRPMVPQDRPQLAAFSPSGDTAWALGFEGLAQAWDARTGALRKSLMIDAGVGSNRLYSLAFHPDGRHAVIGGYAVGAVIDLQSMTWIRSLPGGNTNGVRRTLLSPDGKWLFSVMGGSHEARFIDFEANVPVGETVQLRRSIRSIAVSPDGRMAATGARDGSLGIWQVPTGRPVLPLLWHTGIVVAVNFSPDSKLIASASDDFEARIWSTSTGALLHRLRHLGPVADVKFSPDGTKVVTASEDHTARLWDVATGRPIGEPMHHRNWVRMAAFSPDSTRVVTASYDNTTRIWSAETARPLSDPMAHQSEVLHVEFAPNGKSVLSAVSTTACREIWHWQTIGQRAHALPLLTGRSAIDGAFSRDGERIAAGSADGTVRIWHRRDGFKTPVILSHTNSVSRVAFSPDGKRLAVVEVDGLVFWELDPQRRIRAGASHHGGINSLAFGADGSRVVTASADGTTAVWNSATGERLKVLSVNPEGVKSSGGAKEVVLNAVFTAVFSADGRRVLTASRNGTAMLWDVESGAILHRFEHKHWVMHAEFSPDGRRIVTASVDRNAQVWDAETGKAVGAPMVHESDALCAHFSPDGKRIVTGSLDWTARIWNAEDGSSLSEVMRHQGPVRFVRFSPDGTQVATGGDDGMVRLWDGVTGQPLSNEYHHSSEIQSLQFNARGDALLVVPRNDDPRVYDVLQPPYPAPAWLPELAEAIAGRQLGEDGRIRIAAPDRLFELRGKAPARQEDGFYAHWLCWLLGSREQRPISPGIEVKEEDYIARRIEAGAVADLRGVIALQPTNALAHAKLALQMMSENPGTGDIRIATQARWHIDHAVKLAPADASIRELAARYDSIHLGKGGPQASATGGIE